MHRDGQRRDRGLPHDAARADSRSVARLIMKGEAHV